jgi:toxin ParE1/3/4
LKRGRRRANWRETKSLESINPSLIAAGGLMKRLDYAFASLAERDLEAIQDFLAEQYPDRDVRFTREVRSRIEQLRTFPELGRPFKPVADARIIVIWDFLLIYRVSDHMITIERVIHGARDIDSLLD